MKGAEPSAGKKVKEAAAAADEAARTKYLVGPEKSRPTKDELTGVPYKPKMIVEGYLPEDASGDVAPGGTGKSTLQLYEAVHVILGRPLYGRHVVRTGAVLIITAEDDRPITLSRLNQVCNALNLTKRELDKVRKHFHIEDVSASDAKLVVADFNGIRATQFFDEIVEKYEGAALAVIVLDPTSHLGPGETAGNDGMAQYLRTARALSRALGAAVRIVHHVAQAVARGDIKDQYAGRGGTAFADNSRGQRQVIVWRTRKLKHEGSDYELPGDITDRDISEGNVLGIFVHKISYARRDSTPIVVVRNGFAFKYVPMDRVDNSAAARLERAENEMWRVVDYIRGQLLVGKKISKSDMDEHAPAIGLTRNDLRGALKRALNVFALAELPLPKIERVTNRTKYLSPDNAPPKPGDLPNPANPAVSRRNSAGGITLGECRRAANPAADATSIRRRDSKASKTTNDGGIKGAGPGRIPPKSAAAKAALNGNGVGHA